MSLSNDSCIVQKIRAELFLLSDDTYRDFSSRLMPTVDPAAVLGVRIPQLRKMAASLRGDEAAEEFLSHLPHLYYEENNLHAFLIAQIKDFSACVSAVDRFLPYVDNWATCDSLRPSCFKKHPFELFGMIDKWLKSEHVYTVRFAVGMLMVNYLDKNFDPEQMSKAAAACCDEYYVNMMVAWYFATALAKRYDHALLYLEQERLPLWVHNKTIQKAVESYRISAVQKAYLRTLRRR